MKKLITILLLAISGFASAQQYQLNYADIRIGNLNSKTAFRGNNILMPYIPLGLSTDSVLTIAGGQIKKVPRSQFSGGGSSYTFNNGLTESSGVVGLGGNANWEYLDNLYIGNGQNNGYLLLNNGTFGTGIGGDTDISGIIGTVNDLKLFSNPQDGGLRREFLLSKTDGILFRDDVDAKGINGYSNYWSSKSSGTTDDNYYTQRGEVKALIASSGGGYTLPIASTSVLGGIKVGSGLSIDGAGVLSTVGGSAPDTTIYRTVSNSFSKSQTNTQISNAIASYTPPSQVDNDLSASTTRAPSKSAVNTALGLKADDANVVHKTGNETIAGVKTFSNSPVVGTSTANTTINANSIYFNQSGGNFLSLQPPTLTGIRLQNFQDDDGQIALTKNITKAAVGLSNVDNTSDANKPVSTAQQTALDGKQNNITLTTTGTSGAATLVGATLNIPNYATGGGSYTAGYGIGIASNVISADTASTNGLVSKSRLTASLQNFNVTARFKGVGTVGDPFDLNTVTVPFGGTGVTTLTGIVKGNGTSAFTAAVAGDFPTLNQNTTGSAASLTTSRNLWGVGFNGTANVTAKPTFTAGTTASASINIAQGVAPTTPANGDIWNTSTVQQHRIGGVTKTVAYTTDITTPTLQQVTTSGNMTTNGLQVTGNGIPTSLGKGLTMTYEPSLNGGAISSYDYPLSTPLKLYLNPSGGNILIGTTTDNGTKLQVNGSMTATGDIGINGNISASNLLGAFYTPTITGTANYTTGSAGKAHYIRVGNEVTVFGVVNVTATAGTTTTFELPLPVASNLTNVDDLTGSMTMLNTNGSPGYFTANTSTDRAFGNYVASTGGVGVSTAIHYQYMYTVK